MAALRLIPGGPAANPCGRNGVAIRQPRVVNGAVRRLAREELDIPASSVLDTTA